MLKVWLIFQRNWPKSQILQVSDYYKDSCASAKIYTP